MRETDRQCMFEQRQHISPPDTGCRSAMWNNLSQSGTTRDAYSGADTLAVTLQCAHASLASPVCVRMPGLWRKTAPSFGFLSSTRTCHACAELAGISHGMRCPALSGAFPPIERGYLPLLKRQSHHSSYDSPSISLCNRRDEVHQEPRSEATAGSLHTASPQSPQRIQPNLTSPPFGFTPLWHLSAFPERFFLETATGKAANRIAGACFAVPTR